MTNLIPPHGGYKNLKSFQMSEIVFDLTMDFTKRYIKSFKLSEQIEGAARSGKQNISEGSQTSGTSKQSELRLVDVARASLEELLNDYKDFLRINNLVEWGKDDARVLAIRKLAYESNRSYTTYTTYMSNAESAANCLLTLINQANYLLDQQLRVLEKDLAQHGDFKDRYKEVRKQQLLDSGPPVDEFLKSQGLRRLENGRVVGLNEPDE